MNHRVDGKILIPGSVRRGYLQIIIRDKLDRMGF
jgi:hypothetical protein